VAPDATLYGFDPWPHARTFFDHIGFPTNVELIDVALASSPGGATFYDYMNACNSLAMNPFLECATASYEVNVTTFDRWCAERQITCVDFLKVDVEGYDLSVLEGSSALLSRQAIYAFMFEYGSNWIGSRRYLHEACSFIQDHGYSLFKLFPHFLAPYNYKVVDETFSSAMFVGLSRDAVESSQFTIRTVPGI
jgi:FkbM family methyltransferase